MGWLSPEHFPGAIPQSRPWPGGVPSRALAPEGRAVPAPTFAGALRGRVGPCRRPGPEGS